MSSSERQLTTALIFEEAERVSDSFLCQMGFNAGTVKKIQISLNGGSGQSLLDNGLWRILTISTAGGENRKIIHCSNTGRSVPI